MAAQLRPPPGIHGRTRIWTCFFLSVTRRESPGNSKCKFRRRTRLLPRTCPARRPGAGARGRRRRAAYQRGPGGDSDLDSGGDHHVRVRVTCRRESLSSFVCLGLRRLSSLRPPRLGARPGLGPACSTPALAHSALSAFCAERRTNPEAWCSPDSELESSGRLDHERRPHDHASAVPPGSVNRLGPCRSSLRRAVPDVPCRAVPCRAVPCRAVPSRAQPR
jgi:hypothetical protein